MRIIAGKWRSRKIDWPDQGRTRPITDRLREALFDLLGSRYATLGALPPLIVGDVFAGGGSLGIEALSRGAARVVFAERDRVALRLLKRNLDRLQVGPEGAIVSADLWRAGLRLPEDFGPLDLVFLDPPFADARDTASSSKTASLLRRLGSPNLTKTDTLVVLRHESRIAIPSRFGTHWEVDDRREYGSNAITLLTRVADSESDAETETETATDPTPQSPEDFGYGLI